MRQSAKRQRTPDVLTVEDIRRILAELSEPYHTLLLIVASTGLRGSGLRGLKWADIDFDGRTINLQRGVVRGHIGELKTASSKRIVPIAPELAACLMEHRQRTAYNQSYDWVLASEHTGGSPLSGSIRLWSITSGHQRNALGCSSHISWHTFRHSFATLLKANGEDIKTVQESLRHATVRITMETYTQAVPENIRQAQEKIAAQLFGAPAAKEAIVAP